MRRFLVAGLAMALMSVAVSQPFDPGFFNGLHWRLIGPYRGGRALAVTGVPGSPEKFYFGAVGGGVWESDNAGRTWFPIFDKQHVASIGAIAVAPSNPNVIYVGTGEADMRNDIQQGDGMYRSSDGGKTWAHIGLEDTRQIGKVLVDPKDPDTVYVAALGHQYGPNEERGVFKTVDGGKTWEKVLYKNPNVGAIDLAMDPTDSNVVFASLWSTRRPPWSLYPPSNGPGGGLFKSTDAGRTWTQAQGHGLPSFVGHIGLSISPADHERIYACIDTNDFKTGGVYRSEDGGSNWTRMDGDGRLWMRGWYFCGVTADPKDPDTVYVMNTSTYRSTDGGKTFTPIKGAPGGDDYHALWIEPDDSSRMILGCDQGVIVSVDGARTWSSWYNQPTGQFYHVVADNRFPYWVYGAQQDSGAMAVPSRTIHTGISGLDWRPIDAGGESGTIAPDPLHPGLLFSSGGSKEEFDTAWEQSIDPTLSRTGTTWRNEWTMPIVVSTIEAHVVYMSHQQIFRSQDGGASWKVISPDLTRPRDSVPKNLDPATAADSNGLPRNGVVYWIAPSPVRPHQIWAGTDDGLIWLTRDEGLHWSNVTPPSLTPWSKVGVIDASHFSSETAYAAIDRHRLDDNHPYIYRTLDGGKHWKLTTNGLPSTEFVNVVREDPERAGLLYAGTDWGVFVSFDDGDHWQPFQLDLPAASVRDIVFRNGDIVVATHGRAMYILDDASVMRQVRNVQGAALFRPRPALIFQRAGTFGFGQFNEGTPLPLEEPQGENPPWGALIDYYLPHPSSQVTFTVKTAGGKVMRKLSSSDKVPAVNLKALDIPAYWVRPAQKLSAAGGAHRLVWDLRYHGDSGPLVPPGQYVVTMTLEGKSYSQPLEVKPDPRIPATAADLRAQFALSIKVGDELAEVAAGRSKAENMLKTRGPKMTAAQRARLKALIGPEQSGTPDEGGTVVEDFSSLRFLGGALGALNGAVQSAPAAPTTEYLRAFEVLKRKAAKDLAELNSLSR